MKQGALGQLLFELALGISPGIGGALDMASLNIPITVSCARSVPPTGGLRWAMTAWVPIGVRGRATTSLVAETDRIDPALAGARGEECWWAKTTGLVLTYASLQAVRARSRGRRRHDRGETGGSPASRRSPTATCRSGWK